MKTLGILLSIITISAFAQTKTSIKDGNFYDFTTWDCTCLPSDGDSLVINHQLVMNFGIAYTQGQIYISSQGSLTDNNTNKDIYINGGSLINYGTISLDGFLLDSGYTENNGELILDSLLTRDLMVNTESITVFDFAHDENATFVNNGEINVTNNFNNQGTFENNQLMTVVNDYSNCNIQSTDALFDCDGTLCVQNDFLNCGTDTLRGGGMIYIGGNSTNGGEVEGSLTINTSSGSFTFNSGNVEGTVTFGTAACGLNTEETNSFLNDWIIYPNPAINILKSSIPEVRYNIYDINGKEMLKGLSMSGEIHIGSLIKGSYMIVLEDKDNVKKIDHFIKL
ncbi:MAG: T9SS type A sorting domain-containing protein [Crocinitomicaceae bacterium]